MRPTLEGHRTVIEGCFDAEVVSNAYMATEIRSALETGVGIRVSLSRLSGGGAYIRKVRFDTPMHLVLPEAGLVPTEDCRSNLENAQRDGLDIETAYVIQEVLSGELLSEAMGRIDGKGQFAVLGDVEVHLETANTQASPEPLAVAFRVRPLGDVVGDWVVSSTPSSGAAQLHPALFEALARDLQEFGYEERDERRVRTLYETACQEGELLACQYKTWHRVDGVDLSAALPVFEPACEAEPGAACAVVSWAYSYGGETMVNAPSANPAVAFYSAQRACDARVGAGCLMLALAYEQGLGGRVLETRSAELYREACEADVGTACASLGFYYTKGYGGLSRDDGVAHNLYEQACELGAPLGCLNAGVGYADGLATVRDPEAALDRAMRACEAGLPDGCVDAALELEGEDGSILENLPRALGLYKRGCIGGDRDGCYFAADMYAHGEGTRADRTIAIAYLEKALALGDLTADASIGHEHFMIGASAVREGRTAEDNSDALEAYSEAYDHLVAACRHRQPRGCFHAAELRSKSTAGFERDPAIERSLYKEGCTQGHEKSCKALETAP